MKIARQGLPGTDAGRYGKNTRLWNIAKPTDRHSSICKRAKLTEQAPSKCVMYIAY